MKKGIIAAVLLLVVVGIAGVGLYVSRNIDGLVKDMVETIGTDVTGTQVAVTDVTISLTDGAGAVSGLTVANPSGFSQNSLFALNSIMIDIDPASLTEDVYVIESISIDGARVLAEQIGTTSNIQALLDGMNSGTADSDSQADSAESDVLLAVNGISFTDGNVKLKSDVFGERDLVLPDFILRDLGSSTDGMTPSELGAEIAGQLTVRVKDAVVSELRDLAKEAAREKLKEQIGGKAAEGVEKLKSLFGRGG